MALPKLTATDEMKQIAASDLPRKEKIAYGYVQEVCEYYVYLRCITQDGILKVAFFFPEHLRIDGNSPAYEVYLDKEKRQFITYNSLNQKWCEAKLDRLDWKRRYWYTKAYWVSEEDETSIQAYLNINKKAVEAIRQFQRNVREEQLEQRHRRETDPWDKDMEQVPELPKDWNRWVDKVAIRQNYIYYHYKKAAPKQVTVPTAKRKCRSRCIPITINKAAVAAADIRWYSKPMDERGICRQKNILPT